MPIPTIAEYQKDEYTFKQIEAMAIEMIFQMTGKIVPEEQRCMYQGDANYQIVMSTFKDLLKIN